SQAGQERSAEHSVSRQSQAVDSRRPGIHWRRTTLVDDFFDPVSRAVRGFSLWLNPRVRARYAPLSGFDPLKESGKCSVLCLFKQVLHILLSCKVDGWLMTSEPG